MLRSVRRVPWFILLQTGMLLHRHWRQLSPADRLRASELVRKSGGRPDHLTREERAEFRRIVSGLDLTGIARDMAPFGRRLRGRR